MVLLLTIRGTTRVAFWQQMVSWGLVQPWRASQIRLLKRLFLLKWNHLRFSVDVQLLKSPTRSKTKQYICAYTWEDEELTDLFLQLVIKFIKWNRMKIMIIIIRVIYENSFCYRDWIVRLLQTHLDLKWDS